MKQKLHYDVEPFEGMSDEQIVLANIQTEAVALACQHIRDCLRVDAKMAKGMLEEFFSSGMTTLLQDDLTPALRAAVKRRASMRGFRPN